MWFAPHSQTVPKDSGTSSFVFITIIFPVDVRILCYKTNTLWSNS